MTELLKSTAKLFLVVLLMLLVAVLSFAYGIQWGKTPTAQSTQIRSTGPTVTQLERIGELTTTRVHVTDVLFAEGEGYRGSWLIKGDALLSCDMSQAKIVKVDAEKRTATIHLPVLRVLSARVDHDKTKTWSVEKTSWLPWSRGDQGIIRDTAMFHAQNLVEAAAGSERHLTTAKIQTERLIRQIYDFVGWKVDVVWE